MSKSKSPDGKVDLEALREKQMSETEAAAKKQRFALFSSPPPLCVGENSDVKKLPPRDANGKVKTLNRNIQVSHPKAGKIKSSYFNNLSFITIDDKYYDPGRLDRLKNLEQNKSISKDKGVFKPANFYKTIVKPSFEHKTDLTESKRTYRDHDGKVILQPKNIVTGPEFKPLYKSYGHMPDEYERTRALDHEARLKHIAKLRDAPFRNMDHGERAFVKDSKTYGLDKPLPEKRPRRDVQLNIAEHDGPFRPSNPPKKGYNKTIGKFPEYKGNPIKPLKRIDLAKSKDAFKTCHCGGLTRPTPSITAHPINIKREIMSTSHLLK